jgi:hypothetical protein
MRRFYIFLYKPHSAAFVLLIFGESTMKVKTNILAGRRHGTLPEDNGVDPKPHG